MTEQDKIEFKKIQKHLSYLRNKERYRERKAQLDKQRYQRLKAENPNYLLQKSRDWRAKNRERDNLRKKEFYYGNSKKHLESTIQWQKRNPEKRKAHLEIRYAIKRGDLKKLPCEICGSNKSHAHHSDYSRPLEVRWLCQLHHKQEHIKKN